MGKRAVIVRNRRLALTVLCFAGTVAIAGFVIASQVGRVRANPFCCADDGYFSLIARHLAETGAYALPLADDQARLFDAAIGSGPPLILLGALVVALFGPSAHLLPFAVLSTLAAQISIATWRLARRKAPNAVALYIATSLAAFYIATVWHPYHGWFMGEGIAFGFLFLGCAVLVAAEASTVMVALAGLSFSMAILTKNITVPAVGGALAVWLATEVLADRLNGVRRGFTLGAFIALPIAAFELIKLIALGWAGYGEHWRTYRAILSELHPDRPNRMQEIAGVLNSFSVTPLAAGFALLSLVTLVTLLVAQSIGRRPRSVESVSSERVVFGLMLFAAAAAQLAYAIFVSSLSPRYFWIGVMLGVFAATTPILIPKWPLQLVAIVAFFIMVANPGALARAYQLHSAGAKNGNADELRFAIAYVEQRAADKIMAQSWHSGHSMIYLLRWPRSWRLTNSESDLSGYRGLIVIDQRFEGRDYPFSKYEHRLCDNAFPAHKTFTVLVCDGKMLPTVAEGRAR